MLAKPTTKAMSVLRRTGYPPGSGVRSSPPLPTGMRYDSSNQAPRSINLHRGLQNGEEFSGCTGSPHIGQPGRSEVAKLLKEIVEFSFEITINYLLGVFFHGRRFLR